MCVWGELYEKERSPSAWNSPSPWDYWYPSQRAKNSMYFSICQVRASSEEACRLQGGLRREEAQGQAQQRVSNNQPVPSLPSTPTLGPIKGPFRPLPFTDGGHWGDPLRQSPAIPWATAPNRLAFEATIYLAPVLHTLLSGKKEKE